MKVRVLLHLLSTVLTNKRELCPGVPNDSCENAEVVTLVPSAVVDLDGDTADAYGYPFESAVYGGTASNVVFYSMVGSGHYVNIGISSPEYLEARVLEGPCDNLQVVTWSRYSTVQVCVPKGVVQYVAVSHPGLQNSGTFTLSIETLGVLCEVSLDCENPAPLSSGDYLSYSVQFTESNRFDSSCFSSETGEINLWFLVHGSGTVFSADSCESCWEYTWLSVYEFHGVCDSSLDCIAVSETRPSFAPTCDKCFSSYDSSYIEWCTEQNTDYLLRVAMPNYRVRPRMYLRLTDTLEACPEYPSCSSAFTSSLPIEQTYAMTTALSSHSATPCYGSGPLYRSRWFAVVGNGNIFRVEFCSSTGAQLSLGVMSAQSCEQMNQCVGQLIESSSCASPSAFEWCGDDDVSYFVVLHGEDDPSIVQVSIIDTGAACGETCTGAIEAGIGMNVVTLTQGNPLPPPSCAFSSETLPFGSASVLWMSIEATVGGTLVLSTCGSPTPALVEVLDSCTTFSCLEATDVIDCGGSMSTTVVVQEQVSYFVVVPSTASLGEVHLQLEALPPPPNLSLCDRAVMVQANNGVVLGDTTFTDPGSYEPQCEGGTDGQWGHWYKWVGTGETVLIDTCQSCLDTRLNVYEGHCPTDTSNCVAGSEDSVNTCDSTYTIGCDPDFFHSYTSEVSFCSKLDEMYIIRVSGWSGRYGKYRLNVNTNPGACVLNNDQCSAFVVSSFPFSTTVDTSSATADSRNCGGLQAEQSHTVWYKFEGSGLGMDISTCFPDTEVESQVVVMEGGCSTFGSACVRSAQNQCLQSLGASVSFCGTVGTTYWIGISSDIGGIVRVDITEGSECTLEASTCATATNILFESNEATVQGSTQYISADTEVNYFDYEKESNLNALMDTCGIELTRGGRYYRLIGADTVVRVKLCADFSARAVILHEQLTCDHTHCMAVSENICQNAYEFCAFNRMRYVILVDSDADAGHFTLTATDSLIPCIGDDPCESAVELEAPLNYFRSFYPRYFDLRTNLVGLPLDCAQSVFAPAVTQPSLWFYYAALTSGPVAFSSAASWPSGVIGLFKNEPCGQSSFQCWLVSGSADNGCSSGSGCVDTCMRAGDHFYIGVWTDFVFSPSENAFPVQNLGFHGKSYDSWINLCENDSTATSCELAFSITADSSVAIDARDMVPAPIVDACSSALSTSYHRWLTLEGTSKPMTVKSHSCLSSIAMRASVFRGSCGALHCVVQGVLKEETLSFECNSFEFCSVSGETYFIAIEGLDVTADRGFMAVYVDEGAYGCAVPPGQPWSMSISYETIDSFVIGWRAVVDVDVQFPTQGYMVLVKDTSDQEVYRQSVGDNFAYVTGLPSDASFDIEVAAFNEFGSGIPITGTAQTLAGVCSDAVDESIPFGNDMPWLLLEEHSFSRQLVRGNVISVNRDATVSSVSIATQTLWCDGVLMLYELSDDGLFFLVKTSEAVPTPCQTTYTAVATQVFFDVNFHLCAGHTYLIAISTVDKLVMREGDAHQPSTCLGTVVEGMVVEYDRDIPSLLGAGPRTRPYFITLHLSDSAPRVTGFTSTAGLDNIALEWHHACSASGYSVGVLGPGYEETFSTQTASLVITGLESGNTYQFTVSALLDGNVGPASEYSVKTRDTSYTTRALITSSRGELDNGGAFATEVVASGNSTFLVGSFSGNLAIGGAFIQGEQFNDFPFTVTLNEAMQATETCLFASTGTGSATVQSSSADGVGFLYILGEFTNELILNGISLLDRSDSDGQAVFILKMTPSCNVEWVRTVTPGSGSSSGAQASKILIDSTGHIVAIGTIYDMFEVEGAGSYGSDAMNLFIVRYTISGAIDWVKVGNTYTTDNTLHVLQAAVDVSDNILLLGTMSLTLIFVEEETRLVPTVQSTSGFFRQPYLVKISKMGDFIWGRSFAVGESRITHLFPDFLAASDTYIFFGLGIYPEYYQENAIVMGRQFETAINETDVYHIPSFGDDYLFRDGSLANPFVTLLFAMNIDGEVVWVRQPEAGATGYAAVAAATSSESLIVGANYWYYPLQFGRASDFDIIDWPVKDRYDQTGFYMVFNQANGDLEYADYVSRWQSSYVSSLAVHASTGNLLVAGDIGNGWMNIGCSGSVSNGNNVFVADMRADPYHVDVIREYAPPCSASAQFLTATIGRFAYPDTVDKPYAQRNCSFVIAPAVDVVRIELSVSLLGLGEEDYLLISQFVTKDVTEENFHELETEVVMILSGRNNIILNKQLNINVLQYGELIRDRPTIHSDWPLLVKLVVGGSCHRPGVGFEIIWEGTPPDAHCDNEFSEIWFVQSGTISEQPRGGYKPSANCEFLMLPLDAQYITGEFTFWDLCPSDYVEVFDGFSLNAPSLGKFYGETSSGKIQSSGPQLLLQFVSGTSCFGEGFSFSFNGINDPQYCIGSKVETGPTGLLQSHVVDGPYAARPNCQWILDARTTPSYDKIYLQFLREDINPDDSIMVMEETDCQTSYTTDFCTTILQPEPEWPDQHLYIGSNYMKVVFQGTGVSDPTYNGFEASYCFKPVQSDCDTTLDCRNHKLTNVFCGSTYANDAHCTTVVRSSESTTITNIMFVFDALGFHEGDSLVIKTGSTVVQRFDQPRSFYEPTLPFVFAVSADEAILEFSSNDQGTDIGYSGVFCALDDQVEGCNGAEFQLLEESGAFSNKFCGGFAPLDAICQWSIIAPAPGTQLQISFDVLQFPDEDFVQQGEWLTNLRVFVDDTLFRTFNKGGQHSGVTPPQLQRFGSLVASPLVLFVTADSKVTIEYESSLHATVGGFEAQYCMFPQGFSCDETVVTSPGSIATPTCQSFYLADSDCTWHIQPTGFVAGEDVLRMSVESADVPNADELLDEFSPNDYFSIYDGPTVSDPLLVTIKNSEQLYDGPRIVYSETGVVTANFVSDNSIFGKGVSLSFCTVPSPVEQCGGPKTIVAGNGQSGKLIDHDEACGSYFAPGITCVWHVRSQENKRNPLFVILVVTNFDLGALSVTPPVLSLFEGSVLIQDSQETNPLSPPIEVGRAFFATSQIDVVFSVPPTAPLSSGWAFDYFVSADDGKCRGTQSFSNSSGFVRDHVYGNFYEEDVVCGFLIRVPSADSLTVRFETFDLEANFDFLEVYDGDSVNAPLIHLLSGNTVPTPFKSSTNTLFMLFSSDQVNVRSGFELFYTDSTLAECPLFCSGRGTCNAGVCACDAPWLGSGCEIPPPPLARTATLDQSLNRVIVSFGGRRTNRAGAISTPAIDCDIVFELATTSTFGDGSHCLWRNDGELDILFGAEATLVPGESLHIRGGVIRDYEDSHPFAAAHNVTLSAPLVSLKPTVILNGPSEASSESDLVLTAKLSFLDGARPATFDWDLAHSPGVPTGGTIGGVSALSPAMVELFGVLSAETGPQLILPRTLMIFDDVGFDFAISCTATNFLGTSSDPETIDIDVVASDTLNVAIEGSLVRRISIFESLNVHANIRLPSFADADADVQIFWTSSGGDSTFDTRTRTTRDLFIPSGVLDYDTQYVYEITVVLPENVAMAKATVVVITDPIALDVTVLGGNRQVSREAPLELEIVDANDPALLPGSLVYQWGCSRDNGGPCTRPQDPLALPDSAVITIPAETLGPGTYIFNCVVSLDTNPALQDVSSVEITVLRADQIAVQIDGPSKHDASKPLVLSASIDGEVPAVTYKWTVTMGGEDIPPELLLSFDGASQFAIKEEVLLPGADYTFAVRVTSGSIWGLAERTVTINRAPFAGEVLVSPVKGTTLTEVTIRMPRAMDDVEDMPLEYLYGYRPATCDTALTVDGQCPEVLLSNFEESNEFDAVFPPGQHSIFVEVYDRFGSFSRSWFSDTIIIESDCSDVNATVVDIIANGDRAVNLRWMDKVQMYLNQLSLFVDACKGSFHSALFVEVEDARERWESELLANLEDSRVILDRRIKSTIFRKDVRLSEGLRTAAIGIVSPFPVLVPYLCIDF